MLAKSSLPRAVNAVGDRIGLNYGLDRKDTALRYIDETKKDSRLDFDQLRNSFYSLTEARTVKDQDGKHVDVLAAKNPLKLNSRLRKQLYRLTNEEKKNLRYSTFQRVNELWKSYTRKVLAESDQMGLFRMDLHGCKMKCTASNNPTLVGAEGIVVQETKNTFLIIRETNRLLVLPKRESIFEFEADDKQYRIHGCNLLLTVQTRSKVKYKRKRSPLDI